MTNPVPMIAEPLLAPPMRSARRRFRIFVGLIGVYLLLAFAAPILTGEAGLFLLKSGWRDVDQHWLYGCVILIAGWVAVGQGQMALRAFQGLIAVGWLLLAWLLGLTMSPNWKFELELTILVCLIGTSTTFAALTAIRIRCGKMLIQTGDTNNKGSNRFQYSLTTLLLVILLVGLTITLFGWIDPKYRNYVAMRHGQWLYGPWWPPLLEEGWKEALSPLLITAACLPAFLSHCKRGIAWALVVSTAVLAITVVMDARIRRGVLFPLVQGVAVQTWVTDYYLVRDIANATTVTLCLLTAAAFMHWLGYRIQAQDPHPGPLLWGRGSQT